MITALSAAGDAGGRLVVFWGGLVITPLLNHPEQALLEFNYGLCVCIARCVIGYTIRTIAFLAGKEYAHKFERQSICFCKFYSYVKIM